jgi:hypothetical protein
VLRFRTTSSMRLYEFEKNRVDVCGIDVMLVMFMVKNENGLHVEG